MDEYDRHFQQVHRSLDSVSDHLERQTSTLASVHGELDRIHRAVRAQVAEVAEGQQALASQVSQLNRDFGRFAERTQLDLRRLTATVGLVDLRAMIARDYGPYLEVRKTMQGILNVMDSGLAHDATMQFVAETKLIEVSGYWLSSILGATVAWLRTDQHTMENALAYAMSRNLSRTSLFAGLLNARYHRFEATDSWFRQYLRTQDPLELGDEFLRVLDSAVLGVLGTGTRQQIDTRCKTWFDQLSRRPELVAAQVDRWKTVLARRSRRDADPVGDFQGRYQILTEVSAGWREVAQNLHRAEAFALVRDGLRIPSAVDATATAGRVERIDQILANLNSLPELGERELRNQERELLRMAGPAANDQTLAEVREDEAALDESTTDFLTLISNMALYPAQFKVSVWTTQLATHLARDWIGEAVTNARDFSASQLPETMPITIENWSAEIGLGTTADQLAESLGRQLDLDATSEEERETRSKERNTFGAISVALLLLWIAFVSSGVPLGALRSLLASALCVAGAAIAVVIHVETPRRLRETQSKGRRRKVNAIETLHAAVRAHDDLIQRWNLRLKEAEALREFVRSIELPDFVADDAMPGLEAAGSGSPSSVSRSGAQSAAPLPSWNLKPSGW